MKKKLGIRALAALLAASVVMSASSGAVFAKNNGANVSVTGDVSDTSAASETSTRVSAKNTSANVSVEGAALSGVKAPSGLTGEGTSSSPYQVGSLSEFLQMSSYINYDGSSAKEFVLTNDINLSKVTFSDFTDSDGIWSLVSAKPSLSGNSNVRFRLNGDGHKLYGLNVTLSKNAAAGAIFGCVNANSVIEDLKVESCTVRVNRTADGAYAVLAVQNNGTIRNVTMSDCVLDARLAVVQKRASDAGYVSQVSGNRVYVGHALGIADNVGKVSNFTVTASDANKGVLVKGGRRFVGVVAGQNRKDLYNATVSGVRVLSYGSDDADTSIAGKGVVASSVGVVAGKNDKSATISAASVTLKNKADVLFGDLVGGIAGENAGTIADSAVRGTSATGTSVTASSANLYGYGRFGAIAGDNSGTIRGCGAYDVGACFAQNDAQNAYGGVAGSNSGTISDCAATGSVNLQNATASGVGGLIGCARAGATLIHNYALVSASSQEANVGALVGKDGTMTYIGQNNYWSSQASGLTTPVPNDGAGQNDLTPAKPVIVLTENTSGTTLSASALAWSWQGGKVTANADFTKNISVTNSVIRLNKSSNSVTLSSTKQGAVGALTYTVTAAVSAGVSGNKLVAQVSVPVFVTASATNGAGSSVKNPIVISDAQQMQIMQYAPAAHYRLDADITLGSDWTPVDFSGTLDGNGHTVRISKPIFSSVTGSRDGSVSAADWKSSASNLISGYIYDMTIVPTTCVYGGVFGDVKDATLRDVTYTVNDENDGFVALSAPKSGALIDTLSGNAFLYRCKVSVPIAVTAGDAEGIGALVGYASTNALVADSCETTSLMSLEKNLSNVGGLFGNIAGGTTELTNCSATGCVYVSSFVSEVRAKIMVGASSGSVKASGCTYAAAFGVADCSLAKSAAPFTDGVTELKPGSEEAKQGAEDARNMLSLIDPELIEEENMTGLTLNGNVYSLSSAQDVLDMATLIEGTSNASVQARSKIFELTTDIDMNGAELKMSTSYDKAFTGTFRSASGHKYTLSNFTVTNTGTDALDSDTNSESIYYTATGLFGYANGATFQDFALENVTVVSDGVGTAVLVGFADKDGDQDDSGDYTDCSFTNIDITNCNVYSLYSVNGTGYALENAALAGTLIGAVWSANGGEVYTIQDVTVSDCLVENRNWDDSWTYYDDCAAYHTGGGAWSIGGLIGGSRLASGTLCIGDDTASSTSVTLEHVTVTGFSGVGGVIGMAGTSNTISGSSSSVSCSPAGGLKISYVDVTGKTSGGTTQRSSVTAGSGGDIGGACGGILGIEIVVTNATAYAQISHCNVSDTDILSDNDRPLTNHKDEYYTDCGGVAGHMSGKVEYCDVTDCTIQSTTAGGIVGKASRKAGNSAATHLQIDHCNILGETVVGFAGSASSNNEGEAGGLLAAARYASVTITYCGVGSKASISSKHLKYAGGFIGTAFSTSTYPTVKMENCVMAGTVEIPPASDTEGALSNNGSAVGGAVGYAGMHTKTDGTGSVDGYLIVKSCAIGGNLKITGSADSANAPTNCFNSVSGGCAGGVFGAMKSYTTFTNMKVFQIENCVIAPSIPDTTPVRAKLLAYYEGNTTQSATNRWTGLNNIKRAIKKNVYSTYPENLKLMGWYPAGSSTLSGKIAWMGLLVGNSDSYLTDKYLLTPANNMMEDINRPNYDSTNNVFSYLNGETGTYTITGTRSETILVTNTISTTKYTFVEFDDSDGASPNDKKQYGGWRSSNLSGQPVNNALEVVNTTDATTIDLALKNDATNVGVTANYTFLGSNNTDPETGDLMQIAVFIPLALSEIPAAAIGGTGTAADPYQIPDLATLNTLRQRDLSKYYMLTADIDASAGGEAFVPIPGPFTGTLYGKDTNGVSHTISGLTISGADTGLFTETDGATIQDLTISGASVTGEGLRYPSDNKEPAVTAVSGEYAGILTGVANETTFTNITITGCTVGGSSNTAPSAYAGAIAAYATDCTAQKITLNDVTVRYAYFTGGVFGHAHYTTSDATDCSILGTSVIGLSVTSTELATSTVYDGVNSGKIDAAGGIVAEFAGTIGDYTSGGTTTSTSLTKLAASGNDPAVAVTINGSNAGAVIGFADQTRTTGTSVISVTNVTVGSATLEYTLDEHNQPTDTIVPDVTVTSNRMVSGSAAAAGIIGKICLSDPVGTDAPDTTPGIPVTITGCRVNAGVSISAKYFAGGILGHSSSKGSASKITITSSQTFAAVSADQSQSAVGALAGRIFDVTNLEINLCVASGKMTAMTIAGGMIGLVPANYNSNGNAVVIPAIPNNSTITLISNTVYSGTVNVTGTGGSRGVFFGSIPTAVLPLTTLAHPFVNVYYSSYQVPADLRTTSGGVIKLGKLSGENGYVNYQGTVIDLMTDFAFCDQYEVNPEPDDDPNTDDDYIINYSTQLRVPLAGTILSANTTGLNSIRLWSGVTSGNYQSFICPSSVPFVLKEITSDPDLIEYETNNARELTPKAGANDTGDIIFVYANGLELKLNLIASDIKGSGTSSDPFLIERIGHLNAIKSMPHSYFVLAADIDFGSSTTARGDTLTPSELAWADNWEAWVKQLASTDTETVDGVTRYVNRFDGHLSGKYYPYDATLNNGAGGYDTTATIADEDPHIISNLEVENDGSYTEDGAQSPTDVGYYGAGFLPIIESGGTVEDITFSNCSFTASKSGNKTNNAGVLCAENYGTVSGITVTGCGAESEYTVKTIVIVTSGSNELQSHHAGAVAGVSYTALNNCTVTNCEVYSSHCAGGVVGGGKSVTNSTVTGTKVTGREYAGGICGGNLNYVPDSNHDREVPNSASDHATTADLRVSMRTCEFTNCHVLSCVIASDDDYSKDSSVGGILGVAESGDQWNDRSVSFNHCTVDCLTNSHKRNKNVKQTTVTANAVENNAVQQNFAGGILGSVVDLYDGITVENCATYADVYAYGRYAGGQAKTSAGGLIGRVADGTAYKAYDSTLNFKFINNVCGGGLHSAYIAGGVVGNFAAVSTGYLIPENAEFLCGNIISATFERLGESNTGNTSTNGQAANRGFGILIGVCTYTAFTANKALTTMKQNYYSSYVSKDTDTDIPAFSGRGTNPVTADSTFNGMFDVAKYSYNVTEDGVTSTVTSSSFLITNKVYYKYENTSEWRLRNSELGMEEIVNAPEVMDNDQQLKIYPGHPVTANNPATYNMDMQLIFNTTKTEQNGSVTYSYSSDFANSATALTVYTTGIANGDQHVLSLTDNTDIYVTPDDGSTDFYGGARAVESGANKVALTVRKDPELCADTYDLIADLDYGLLVGITIMTNVGTGAIDNPWKIPDAATFAHFFFTKKRLYDDPVRKYLTEYYAQTGDFSWDDVLDVLHGDAEPYQSTDIYGYMDGNNFVEFAASGNTRDYVPIGSQQFPFSGGYDGGWNYDSSAGGWRSTGAGHKITDFHYTAPDDTDDAGLFGYVSSDNANDWHFKNIHIELKETALDSVNETSDGDAAGVFGTVYTGALCARYVSTKPIDNCSVVYGTVRSDGAERVNTTTGLNEQATACVGGLIGMMSGSAELRNCFASCNVRGRDDSDTQYDEKYVCGGLIGLQEGSASQLTDAGTYPCNYVNCFCSSDIVGPIYVGGFVGMVGDNTFVNLTNCASTATVTAITLFTSTNNQGPTLVIGRRSSEGLNNAYTVGATSPSYVSATNVYIAGMNTTEYKFKDSSNYQYYPNFFGVRSLISGSNIYYDSSVVGRVTSPNNTAAPNMIKVNGALCNASGTAIDGTAPFTAMKTADLTAEYAAADPNADPPTEAVGADLGSAFDTSDTSLYPVVLMSNRYYAGEGTTRPAGQNDPDPYFGTFAGISAMPMFPDERELDDDTADRTYAGVTYPTRVSKQFRGEDVTIVSSKFTADANTPAYSTLANDTYDYLLEGNNHRTDMDTDLLFNRGAGTNAATDSANTATYHRTDTRTDYQILRNTDLAYNSGATAQELSETRNERSPFVRIAVTIGNVEYTRTMRIGLRSSGNTSYVSTERQLRAISAPESDGKFATAYANTLYDENLRTGQNIRLCADIDFNPETPTTFVPIGAGSEDYEGSSAGDDDEGAFGFDGSNCEIRNLYIEDRDYAGLFSQIKNSADNAPKIQNLVLRNPTVSGRIACGALAGQILKASSEIRNCSVIGGTITASAANCKVGGLVGYYSNNSGGTPNAKAMWVGVTGVRIVTGSQTSNSSPVAYAGLMFGHTNGGDIKNSYAVGEINGVYAKCVGGIAGYAQNTSAAGVVTSGYISSAYQNPNANLSENDASVGGIFGRTVSGSVVNNAITTAYVSGTTYYAGIVGWGAGQIIKNTIFAGSTSGSLGEQDRYFRNYGSGTNKNICYDRSLQFTALEEDTSDKIFPKTTWQIVSGEIENSVFTDTSNASTFQYDKTTYRYYPNPINLNGYHAPYGDISNVVSDSFKTGLGFALVRINTAYGGTGGSVSEYDEISVTSPIGAVNSEQADTYLETGVKNTTDEMTVSVPKDADKVTLAEYNPDNTALGSGDTAYLAESGEALVPSVFDQAAYAGVRATMDTTSAGTTFKDATLYRFLRVDLCRIAEIEYTVSYDASALALEKLPTGQNVLVQNATYPAINEVNPALTDKIVLMLKTKQKLTSLYMDAQTFQSNNPPATNADELAFSSNAVTGKYQDFLEGAHNASGKYTVVYRKICVPSDGRIYVGAMLPSQYKISGITAYEWNTTNDAYNTNNIYGRGQNETVDYVQLATGSNLTADTKVKINVTVTADPSWGLRDLDGGIG